MAAGQDAAALQRQRTIDQAVDEGHDADIPSSNGFLVNEKPERRASSATKSIDETSAEANTDVENTTPVGNTGDDPNIVWWDGDNDPENPYNWPRWKQWVNCGLISALTFLTPFASSMFAPGVPQLMREFNSTSPELAGFVVSVYVLGFALGPLVIAPLSEIYGRTIIYHICNFGFLAFVIACALAPTMDTLIVFRFFSGVFGSCPITNGGGSIADMIPQERRALVMAGFTIGPLLGPVIGPVAGGFLADAKGWRWNFWLLAIMGGLLTIAMLISLRETYAPIILQRKTERLRKETGNQMLRSKLDAGLSPKDYVRRGIFRPLKMLLFSPICQIFAVYMAIVYGYLYLLYTSITPVFERYYGFTASNVGLVFIGQGLGSILGLLWYSASSDRYMKAKAARHGTGMKPEFRLKLLPIGAVLLPVGFFIYGWTAEYRVHWIVPILGTVVMGFANLIIFMAVQMYLVDTFAMYAASALAANTVIRSIAGAVLPLAGIRMYNVLGMGWGNSLLGFIALVLIPVPFFIQKYGEHIRTRFQVQL